MENVLLASYFMGEGGRSSSVLGIQLEFSSESNTAARNQLIYEFRNNWRQPVFLVDHEDIPTFSLHASHGAVRSSDSSLYLNKLALAAL